MAKKNFTARSVPSWPLPSKGQMDVWDENLAGFGMRLSSGGRRTWMVMYRIGRLKCRLTLGTYPAMSLAKARDEAKAALAAVQSGGDPAAERRAKREAESFGQLAARYIEKYAKPKKKSWHYDQEALNRDVLPVLKNRRPADIARRDIRDIIDEIVNRGAPIQANRTFEVLRRLFNWAVSEDYLEKSPCIGLEKPSAENQRDRVLTEDELRAVWAAIEAESPLVAGIFKLRLITAQRGGEVCSMARADLALQGRDGAWWTIPTERAKNGLTHRVPLSAMALDVINAASRFKHDETWVFPSQRRGRHLEQMIQAAIRIRNRSGVQFVPHDLRRTAASLMTGMGISRLTVGKILNHVERGVTAVYDRHSYDREKREALDAWANRLEAILAGTATDNGKVVSLWPAAG